MELCPRNIAAVIKAGVETHRTLNGHIDLERSPRKLRTSNHLLLNQSVIILKATFNLLKGVDGYILRMPRSRMAKHCSYAILCHSHSRSLSAAKLHPCLSSISCHLQAQSVLVEPIAKGRSYRFHSKTTHSFLTVCQETCQGKKSPQYLS